MRALIIAIIIALGVLPAAAEGPTQRARPPLTGNIPADFQNAVNHVGATTPSGGSNALPCDFNLFASLTANNLVASINACIQSKIEGAVAPLMLDTQNALASAQAYGGSGDATGVNCLKPGLAILQAAAGVTPPTPTPAGGTQTTAPAAATAPAATASPSTTTAPGPVLLFQKWREFVLAGGPSACKSWVTTTIAGGSLLAQ